MSDIDILLNQAKLLKKGKKSFIETYAKDIAGNRNENKIESDEVKSIFNIDSFLHNFKNNSTWRKVQQRTQYKESIKSASEILGITTDEAEDKLIMNIKGIVNEKVSSGLVKFDEGISNIMSYFSKGNTNNVQLRDVIKEAYVYKPLRIFD